MVGMRGLVGFVGASCAIAASIAACTSFGTAGDEPDGGGPVADAADERTTPDDRDGAGSQDTSVSDVVVPATRCSARTVTTKADVQTVQRYLDKLYFADTTAIYVCDAASCSPQQLATGESNVRSFTVGVGYAFWLATAGSSTVVRRLTLSSALVVTLPSPGNFKSVHLTAGASPELVMMGSHLYRAPPATSDLNTSLDIIDFYYQPMDIALTSVGNRVLYNHPAASVALSGPHVCAEGAFCQNAQPVVSIKAPLSSLGVDGNDLYYANDASLYRTAIGATGTDGGVPVPGPPLASFDAPIAFVNASGAELAVVTKDTQSNGRVAFGPKSPAPTTTFVACPRPLVAPTSATADGAEIFVAEGSDIVAYRR